MERGKYNYIVCIYVAVLFEIECPEDGKAIIVSGWAHSIDCIQYKAHTHTRADIHTDKIQQ